MTSLLAASPHDLIDLVTKPDLPRRPLTVSCPSCHATPGQPCADDLETREGPVHVGRARLARATEADDALGRCPPTPAAIRENLDHAAAARPEGAATPTKERLARALADADLPALAIRALRGAFDDFESESATPAQDLVVALQRAGGVAALELLERVSRGEFDTTTAEAEAWMADALKGEMPVLKWAEGHGPKAPQMSEEEVVGLTKELSVVLIAEIKARMAARGLPDPGFVLLVAQPGPPGGHIGYVSTFERQASIKVLHDLLHNLSPFRS